MTNTIPAEAAAALRAELDADTAEYRDGQPEDGAWTNANRGKSVVYSLRLNPEEVARLEASATEVGIPASTLARSLILAGLAEGDTTDLRAAIERLERDLLDVKRRALSA